MLFFINTACLLVKLWLIVCIGLGRILICTLKAGQRKYSCFAQRALVDAFTNVYALLNKGDKVRPNMRCGNRQLSWIRTVSPDTSAYNTESEPVSLCPSNGVQPPLSVPCLFQS